MRRTLRFVIVAALLLLSWRAQAYWGETHENINEQVAHSKPFDFTRAGVKVSSLEEYLQVVLFIGDGLKQEAKGVPFRNTRGSATEGFGADTPSDPATESHTLQVWNKRAGQWEDGFLNMDQATKWGGLRAVNHFHNPIAKVPRSIPGEDGGYSGLIGIRLTKTGEAYRDLLRPGISAARWANGEAAPGGEVNLWGFPTATDSLAQYFVKPYPDDRGPALANALRAIGQVEHLIQDGSVPDHARDLPHPWEGFEDYIKAHPGAISEMTEPYHRLPLKLIEKNGLRGFWDQDLYDGSDPGASYSRTGTTSGITEFANANFLAFNDRGRGPLMSYLDYKGLPVRFTTVPDAPSKPGRRCLGLFCQDFPWPQFEISEGGSPPAYWSTRPNAFPLGRLAWGPDSFLGLGLNKYWRVDEACWSQYQAPLLSWAFGYSQSALALLFQPVEAEIVPDKDAPLNKVRVRVRNLNTPGGENALTWHLESIRITPLFLSPQNFADFLKDADKTVGPGNVAGHDLAPGETFESDAFELDVASRYGLSMSTHTGFAINVTVGDDHKTPLAFGVVRPAGLVVLAQKDTADVSPTATIDVSNCCTKDNPESCSDCGTSTIIHQALQQRITGTIRVYGSHLDAFGNPASGVTLGALDAASRLTGVAVISTGENGFHQPIVPSGSSLTLTGSRLQPVSSTVWLRPADAPDEPDPQEISFQLDLDLAPLITPGGNQKAKAVNAADNVFLIGWTAAGNAWIQPLALWVPLGSSSAPQLKAALDPCSNLFEATGVFSSSCYSNATLSGGSCGGDADTFRALKASTLLSVSGAFKITGPWPTFETVLYEMLLGKIYPTSMAGNPVAVEEFGYVTTPCPNQLIGSGACLGIDGLVGYSGSAPEQGPGACPAIGDPPAMTKEATYKRRWNTETLYLKIALGRDDIPEDYTIQLH